MGYTPMTQAIIECIKSIPEGKVASYGEVASMAGYPGGARQVVRVLSTLSEKEDLPWHRIVKKNGRIALTGSGECEQMILLEREGVSFDTSGQIEKRYFV